jgi:hypothetical protein
MVTYIVRKRKLRFVCYNCIRKGIMHNNNMNETLYSLPINALIGTELIFYFPTTHYYDMIYIDGKLYN